MASQRESLLPPCRLARADQPENIQSRMRNENIKTASDPVELYIELYPPDRRRRDVDNSLKCLLDAFTHGGLYEDDSLIHKLIVVKREIMPPDGMVYIRMRKLCNADTRKSE